MMYWEDATKKQLLQVAFFEDCSLDDKYAAARELQLKRWDSAFLQKLVKYWGNGMSDGEIALKLGVEKWEVQEKLNKYGLYGRRVHVRNSNR